jgi:sugar lactone lactonase YvrE
LKQRNLACIVVVSAAVACLILGARPAPAGQVKIFQTQSGPDFLAGELDGVSLDRWGRLGLAARVEKVAAVEEPFVFAAVPQGDGWLLGTGTSGRVLKIGADGSSKVFFEAEESQVFALLASSKGAVYVATSPKGKVYRLEAQGGAAEVFFDPEETYIWALAEGKDGRLWVATGTRGRLYAVDTDGQGKGKGKVIYDSDEPHLRSLLARPDGGVIVGTAGSGRILRIAADGKVQTLHDAVQPEIVALAAGPDGEIYAAALASEASLVDLSPPPKSPGAAASSAEESEEGGGSPPRETPSPAFSGAGSRPSSFTGARSEVIAITAQGGVEVVGSLQDQTIYSLLWQGEKLWVGTGLDGELYSRRPGAALVLEKRCEEKQVVALAPGPAGPVLVTGNPAALYRTVEGVAAKGTFTSPVLDSGRVARFGAFRWFGQENGRITAAFRSGLSSEPDATWTSWTEPREGKEISLADLPRGRFLQWRVTLEARKGEAPRLDQTELSYLEENQRPRFENLEVLEPGQVLVPANFNPSSQVYEPAHPNRDGIFTTLSPEGGAEARVKPLWKYGYRSLRWQVQDANDDALRFTLYFQPLEAPDDPWLKVADDLAESQYSFDATVLPDGEYRFRVVATDELGNVGGDGLTAEQTTGPVVVDHSPPEVTAVSRGPGPWKVEVEDRWNPLREARISLDAGPWLPVEAADGLVDGRRESLRLVVPAAARLVLLRLTDAAHNVVTVNLQEAKP